MQKRQLLNNSILSILQIIVISGTLLLLYRLLLNTIGIEQFGIWSTVLAISSVSQLTNLGLSGSIVKFTAKYIARKEPESISKVIQTAVLSSAVFTGIILIISYPLIKLGIGLIIPHDSIQYAAEIMPHALLAVWTMLITGIIQGGIDGYQRIDIRSFLLMGGAIFNLLLCFALVPAYGLLGAAYARVIQSVTLLLSSWFFLRKLLPILPVVPFRWNKSTFKEIIGYSFNFQIISVATICYEPATKLLMSKFGGLSMTGYFEMASRLIQQLRSFIISANQVLVPAIADLKERSPEKIVSLYKKSYQLLFYISFPLFSIIIICIPVISELWIGYSEKTFITFATLLAVGWFLNTLASPAYFTYLGTGKLSWNVLAHITIGILNIGLGIILGLFYNGIGVITAWILSLSMGSSIIYLSYHLKNQIPFNELLPQTSILIATTCISIIFISKIMYSNLHTSQLTFMLTLSYTIIILIPVWLHPMRKQLTLWVTDALLNKDTS